MTLQYPVYFAGGMYYKSEQDHSGVCFRMVRKSDDNRPYLTKSENGLGLTRHHASLYALASDCRSAKLVDAREGGVAKSPAHVTLTDEQREAVLDAIRTDYFFD